MRWTQTQLDEHLQRTGMVPGDSLHVDTSDRPFGLPADIDIHLPMPPSVNKIWRKSKAGKRSVSLSEEYVIWKRHADMLAIELGSCRHVRKIMGLFEAQIILFRRSHHAGDLDNRIKAVLDWAQSRELIANDKFCERLVVEWGEAPHGCRLILKPWGPAV